MSEPDTDDPYNPEWERWFKSNSPTSQTPLTEAMDYWRKYELWYGTPQGQLARSLMRTFLDVRAEVLRQTEIITTLRQELKEAKARNTMYLSKIQEFEAREY